MNNRLFYWLYIYGRWYDILLKNDQDQILGCVVDLLNSDYYISALVRCDQS